MKIVIILEKSGSKETVCYMVYVIIYKNRDLKVVHASYFYNLDEQYRYDKREKLISNFDARCIRQVLGDSNGRF